jgi:hypothetical protein
VTVAAAEGHVANRLIVSPKDGAVTSENAIAESRHAQHAESDLTHRFVSHEQVIRARWPRTSATVTTGLYDAMKDIWALGGRHVQLARLATVDVIGGSPGRRAGRPGCGRPQCTA